MRKISLQFHATSDELLSWSREWAEDHSLKLAVERFFPNTACAWAESSSAALLVDEMGGVWDRLWLCKDLAPIVPDADPPIRGNPECFVVMPGRYTEAGLRESAIGGVTECSSVPSDWRRIITDAKARLSKGATVVNPLSSARTYIPNHYYSPGAGRLYGAGVKMLALAGSNVYLLGDRDGSDGPSRPIQKPE